MQLKEGTDPEAVEPQQPSAEPHPFYTMYKVGLLREKPILIDIEINNNLIQMELDTGASVSVMSKNVLETTLGSNIKITPVDAQLRTYTGEIIKPIGIANVSVKYSHQVKTLPIVITPNDGPTLMGRNWLHDIMLDWKSLFKGNVHSVETEENLEAMLSEFEEVFRPELGTFKDTLINIPVPPDAKPKFFRARSVPYALTEKVERELDRLVKVGVYQQVAYSKWAAPIVPVAK